MCRCFKYEATVSVWKRTKSKNSFQKVLIQSPGEDRMFSSGGSLVQCNHNIDALTMLLIYNPVFGIRCRPTVFVLVFYVMWSPCKHTGPLPTAFYCKLSNRIRCSKKFSGKRWVIHEPFGLSRTGGCVNTSSTPRHFAIYSSGTVLWTCLCEALNLSLFFL